MAVWHIFDAVWYVSMNKMLNKTTSLIKFLCRSYYPLSMVKVTFLKSKYQIRHI